MIQFCDRNAEDIPSFSEGPSFDGEAPQRARWTRASGSATGTRNGAHEISMDAVLDPIRLLEERASGPASSAEATTTGDAPLAPPSRVWDSIEATLRKDGLIS